MSHLIITEALEMSKTVVEKVDTVCLSLRFVDFMMDPNSAVNYDLFLCCKYLVPSMLDSYSELQLPFNCGSPSNW